MASRKHFTLKRRYLLIVVGLAVFFVYVYLFVPFGELIEAARKLNPFYFLFAFFALLISVALYSLVWQRLLSLLSVKTSFLKAFQFVWVENFVDLVVPGEPVSGEISRIYLMSKEAGGNYGKVVASAVGQRIATTCVTVTGLLVSIVYFMLTTKPPLLVLAFVGVIMLGNIITIGLLFYLALRKNSTHKLANWLFNLIPKISRGRWRFEQVRERVMKALDIFHDEIITLGEHGKSLILPTVLTGFSWFLDISIAILVFLSLGYAGTAISISAIIIVYCISGSIQYLPIGVIPGEVGLTEIIMTTLFTVLGKPQFLAVFAVATVFIRLLTFWIKLLISGVVVQFTAIENLMPSQALS
jgi:uncharacterized protein (TIRG00374 family)